jgi:tellurite resistance protein TerC
MHFLFWCGFIVFVLGMLAVDLGLLRSKARVMSSSEALRWSGFCCVLAVLFSGLVYFLYEYGWMGSVAQLRASGGLSEAAAGGLGALPSSGAEAAMQFLTAWIVEQSLSIDNIFVIAIIFSFFQIPLQHQHRVLFWGILGALVMRGVMIGIGATLIANFSWVNYLFGALLLYAAAKLLVVKEESFDPSTSRLYKLVTRFVPTTSELDGEKFFTIRSGKRLATPLFLVLVVIESTDLLFAFDSIPAVFAITSDPFLVFTSNVFAILNLRSLYFALASLISRFRFLKVALVGVLFFIGMKMMIAGFFHIPTLWSMVVIVGALTAGILASSLIPEPPVEANTP